MTDRPAFTEEQALQFIAEHELTFLDLCELVLAMSTKVRGMIKWNHPRCVVHIKHAPRKREKKA